MGVRGAGTRGHVHRGLVGERTRGHALSDFGQPAHGSPLRSGGRRASCMGSRLEQDEHRAGGLRLIRLFEACDASAYVCCGTGVRVVRCETAKGARCASPTILWTLVDPLLPSSTVHMRPYPTVPHTDYGPTATRTGAYHALPPSGVGCCCWVVAARHRAHCRILLATVETNSERFSSRPRDAHSHVTETNPQPDSYAQL